MGTTIQTLRIYILFIYHNIYDIMYFVRYCIDKPPCPAMSGEEFIYDRKYINKKWK